MSSTESSRSHSMDFNIKVPKSSVRTGITSGLNGGSGKEGVTTFYDWSPGLTIQKCHYGKGEEEDSHVRLGKLIFFIFFFFKDYLSLVTPALEQTFMCAVCQGDQSESNLADLKVTLQITK